MNPRFVALWAALLPFVVVHLTYLLAASHGLVDWCFPYIDSCTSISATGRQPPASYVFRAGMLPSAVLMMAYWWLNFIWLRALKGNRRPGALYWMLALGVLACFGLIAYVTVLGEPGDQWRRLRRVGTILFFSFTYLAQLVLVGQLYSLRRQIPEVRKPARLMLTTCVVLLLLGLATVIWNLLNEASYSEVENAFEWQLSLLMQFNFLLGYVSWRFSAWRLVVQPGGVDGH